LRSKFIKFLFAVTCEANASNVHIRLLNRKVYADNTALQEKLPTSQRKDLKEYQDKMDCNYLLCDGVCANCGGIAQAVLAILASAV
jgi:hypothetical protein